MLIRAFDSIPEFRVFFEKILRVEGIEGANMLMLPLAFSVGMLLNAAILIISFSKFAGISVWDNIKKLLGQIIPASLLMGGAAYFLLSVLDNFFDIRTFAGIFSQGFAAGILGIAAWFFVLRVMGNRELKEITGSLKEKFWKTPVIAPGPDEL